MLVCAVACGGAGNKAEVAKKPKVDNSPAGRMLRKAMRADMEGRHIDAERMYREALRMRPAHVQTASNLALFLVNRDRLDDAIEVAVGVVRVSDGAPGARHLHAELLMRANKYAEAEAVLDRLIAGSRSQASAYAMRSRARTLQGKQTAAIEDMKRAVEHDGDNPEYLAQLGSLLVRANKLAEAEPHLLGALRVNRRHGLALLGLGVVMRDLRKQPRKALPLHLRAVELLGADHWDARYQLGLTQAANGLHLGAEKNLAWAVRKRPNSGEVWYRYAEVVHFREKWVDAEQAWEQAKKLGVDRPGMVFKLAVARFGVGKFDAAEKLLNKVLAGNADHAHAYLYLGLVHKQRGLRQLAIDALEKYLELAPKDDLLRPKVRRTLAEMKKR